MNEVVVEMRGVSRHFILGKRLMRSAAFICLFFCGLLVGVLFGLTSTANAVTLDNAGQVRDGVSVASLLGTSYDGPDFDAFKPFQGFSGSDILSLSSFTGQANGSQLSAILLSEAACFDGRNPNLANNFGVVDAAGNFMSILDTANVDPGGTGLIAQGADDEFTFALQSPEALFSADDKANADGRAHLIAMQVDKDTTITIDRPTTRGTPAVSFELFAGDIIIFIEDMLASGNTTTSLVPGLGDFDYNDMVVVVRQTEVPEPSTLALMGMALLGLGKKRRRRSLPS